MQLVAIGQTYIASLAWLMYEWLHQRGAAQLSGSGRTGCLAVWRRQWHCASIRVVSGNRDRSGRLRLLQSRRSRKALAYQDTSIQVFIFVPALVKAFLFILIKLPLSMPTALPQRHQTLPLRSSRHQILSMRSRWQRKTSPWPNFR